MKYSILDYFEETERKYQNKIAFSDVHTQISFQELREKSCAIATSILDLAPDAKVVAFYMGKCVETIVGFLGSAYAGCTYSQLNLHYPDKRVKDILRILSPCVIVTDGKHFEDIFRIVGEGYAILRYEEIVTYSVDERLLRKKRESIIDTQPLYINFTSGSTGTPKGVAVGHRSVIDFISCFTEIFAITQDDSIINQAPFDFDVSVKDIYSGLFTGATVHIAPTEYFIQPIKLMDFICDREATVFIWAVSALCFLTSMNCLSYRIPEKLRTIMFSGEIMPIKHLNKLIQFLPNVQMVNLYGPTEITCNCTYHIVDRTFQNKDRMPIGRAFPNEKVFILDENNNCIISPGMKGELCVSGSALALGYYNDRERTEEVFVQNPNNHSFNELIYRTGDIVEFGDDGEMYYCSRKDSQIKHMGHRIELSEIEFAMETIEGLIRAFCFYDLKKDKIIAVYFGDVDKEEVIEVLRNFLPYYMIPNVISRSGFGQIPLNKNGKADRKAIFEEYEREDRNE